MARERIPNTSEQDQRVLFGPMDQNLRAIRARYGVRISVRSGVLLIEGEDAAQVREISQRVKAVLRRIHDGRAPATEEVATMLLDAGAGVPSRSIPGSGRARPVSAPPAPGRGRATPIVVPPPSAEAPDVSPKTPAQEAYVEAILTHDVVISVGPAGTGKTYLAVVQAVEALRTGRARKIILTRPAVEAGEKLGFLPGDFQAKINPYLRPLYDALAELLPWREVQRYMNADVIEIVPLAYMRGRTLKEAFIILDEAQNTTPAQMKMFLTRMGQGSQIVVNGDMTQIDLPDGSRSGLIESVRILRDVKGIAVIELGAADIMRHSLVQAIVDAYDDHETWGQERAARQRAQAGARPKVGRAPSRPAATQPPEPPEPTELPQPREEPGDPA